MKNNNMIYPWQAQEWRQLAARWQEQPNAWLLSGRPNIGKTTFARFMAKALLCETPQGGCEPCGQCPSCHLFEQGTHPDFYELAPDKGEGETSVRKLPQIKIEAVRNIVENIYLTSVRGGRRAVLVHPAENMNVPAANALLKALEEPPPHVVFLLVSHSKDKLLPTVKSRCRQIAMPAPSHEEAVHYLQQQGVANAETLLAFHSGAPLFEPQPELDNMRESLLNLLAQPRVLPILDYAAAFDKLKQPLAEFIGWLQKWLIDVGLAQQNMPPRYYPDRALQTEETARKTNPAALFALSDRLNKMSPYGYHTLNARMQLEDLLLDYLNFWRNKS